MKRDMDLVRKILIRTEESNYPLSSNDYLDDCDDLRIISYHLKIMIQAGLLDGHIESDMSGNSTGFVYGLTWSGQDYLSAVKSDRIWQKTKDHIASKASSATFGIIQEVATKLLTNVIMQGL